ncbi:MAG TPA: zf-HC2 domain-containing protein, partial [Anaeromyxobacteraceae bacterium]|nr:zf-HC2 domain-containing protein [Anaeromyxobacteraceae bacterium]
MKPCPEYDVLLTEDAAGALPPPEAERVREHVAACAGCRAERDAVASVLRGAALPPVSELERRAVADLPDAALVALRRAERRRWVGTRLALGAIAASLLAVLVFGSGSSDRERTDGSVDAIGSLDSAEPAAPLRSGRTEEEKVAGRAEEEKVARRTGEEKVAGPTEERKSPADDAGSLDSAEPAAPPSSGRTEEEKVARRTEERKSPADGAGSLDSAEPAAPPSSGRTDEKAVAARIEPSPFFRGPPRATVRVEPSRQADAPTANGFA